MRYFFAVDSEGRALKGCAVHPFEKPADNCTVEGDEQVWNNQGRAFYVSGLWHIYPPIAVTAPANVNVNEPISVVAVLSPDTPDTEVKFRVVWQDNQGAWHIADPVTVPVISGQASKDILFMAPGKYLIEVLSKHHGVASTEVMVS